MKPFIFGESDKSLFGVYHPPWGGARTESGVVLCAPFGFEYMTSHRAFRQLAKQLSLIGFHVLRFDYYGTGDSAGEGCDASLRQWLEDIETAVEELMDMACTRTVSLVGYRLGATLAAMVSPRLSKLDALVLWNPVITGEEYLAEFLDEDEEEVGNDGIYLEGFPMTASLIAEIREIDLLQLSVCRARRAEAITSQRLHNSDRLVESLNSLDVLASARNIESAVAFGAGDGLSTAVLQPEVQDAVLSFLSEGSRV